MSRNVEIKARVHNPQALFERVQSLADKGPIELNQVDTFFKSQSGRLKWRSLGGQEELIYYQRPDHNGPSLSEYQRLDTTSIPSLKSILNQTLGPQAVVRKKRILFWSGQTRIHLDQVEDLGHFMELETVLRDNQSMEQGQVILESILEQLKIQPEMLVHQAYVDLILEVEKGSGT